MKQSKELFLELVQTDSPSTCEEGLINYIKKLFKTDFQEYGVFWEETVPYIANGEERFTKQCKIELKATAEGYPSLLFCTHLDTVGGAVGVMPALTKDNKTVFATQNTPLGADAKAGITAVLCGLHSVLTKPHGRLCAFFTCMEELGGKGARYAVSVNPSYFDADFCFTLDANTPALTYCFGSEFLILFRIMLFAKHNALAEAAPLIAALPYVVTPELNAEVSKPIFSSTSASFSYSIKGVDEKRVNMLADDVRKIIAKAQTDLDTNVHNHISGERKSCTITQNVDSIPENNQEKTMPPKKDGKIKITVYENSVKGFAPQKSVQNNMEAFFLKAASAIGTPKMLPSEVYSSDAQIIAAYIPTVLVGSGAKLAHTAEENLDMEDLVINTRLVAALCTTPYAE